MSIPEYVFAAIGIIVIIGGFVYAFYDSYLQGKDPTENDNKKS